MLTKIIIYAYTQRIYSSRQIAKAVREHIPFMWLAARQRPDFRTINRFRSERMKAVLETIDCTDCPFKSDCTKAKGNREIRVSMKYLRQKRQARALLQSEEGYKLSVRRMMEPESVFGQMKSNRNFRRFLLRGLPKVSLEVGWLSLAHNLLQWATMNQKGRVQEQV